METRCIIRYGLVLRSFVLFIVACFALTSGQGLRAQAPASAKTKEAISKDKATPSVVKPEDVPADHFDPDDQKTYDDVVFEDRAVTVRGRQFTLHLFRPRANGAATPA